jgi:hypothetical protein
MENMTIERLIMQSANIASQIALIKLSIEDYNKAVPNGNYRLNLDAIDLHLSKVEREVLNKFDSYIKVLSNG